MKVEFSYSLEELQKILINTPYKLPLVNIHTILISLYKYEILSEASKFKDFYKFVICNKTIFSTWLDWIPLIK